MVTLVKVTLYYGDPLTENTGKASEKVIIKIELTALSLLKNLTGKCGNVFKDHVSSDYEKNQVKEGIIISLNAKNISNETMKTKIEDNVIIGIFRPAGGG
jgi:molybdopterin converting factor small subunit